ncbi:hypothetical protein PR048_019680 [Dryococelus australis]|uniref:Uncharacterized protein n=1 Tax=Dryococelus australis TaxID=614101 RepID=A0ABQ9H451_9NEOP|nr:hypothetical protein PR048_019680 [Dryococelus australis]
MRSYVRVFWNVRDSFISVRVKSRKSHASNHKSSHDNSHRCGRANEWLMVVLKSTFTALINGIAIRWRLFDKTPYGVGSNDCLFNSRVIKRWVWEGGIGDEREREREREIERCCGGETGDPCENPPTNGIVRRDSQLGKSGDPAGDLTQFALVGDEWANRSSTVAPLSGEFTLKLITVVQWPDSRLPLTVFDSGQGRSWSFTCGNSAGRSRWSVGFLGDLPFPPPFHSGAAPYGHLSPFLLALKTSLLRAARISSLAHFTSVGFSHFRFVSGDSVTPVEKSVPEIFGTFLIPIVTAKRRLTQLTGQLPFTRRGQECTERETATNKDTNYEKFCKKVISKIEISAHGPIRGRWCRHGFWVMPVISEGGGGVYEAIFSGKRKVQSCTVQRYGGNTAQLARRSDKALKVRVSVARIAASLPDLGCGFHSTLKAREVCCHWDRTELDSSEIVYETCVKFDLTAACLNCWGPLSRGKGGGAYKSALLQTRATGTTGNTKASLLLGYDCKLTLERAKSQKELGNGNISICDMYTMRWDVIKGTALSKYGLPLKHLARHADERGARKRGLASPIHERRKYLSDRAGISRCAEPKKPPARGPGFQSYFQPTRRERGFACALCARAQQSQNAMPSFSRVQPTVLISCRSTSAGLSGDRFEAKFAASSAFHARGRGFEAQDALAQNKSGLAVLGTRPFVLHKYVYVDALGRRLPPTKTDRAPFPAKRLSNLRMKEPCRAMPLVNRLSQGFPFPSRSFIPPPSPLYTVAGYKGDTATPHQIVVTSSRKALASSSFQYLRKGNHARRHASRQRGIGQPWPAIGAMTTSLSVPIVKTITKKDLVKTAIDNEKPSRQETTNVTETPCKTAVFLCFEHGVRSKQEMACWDVGEAAGDG